MKRRHRASKRNNRRFGRDSQKTHKFNVMPRGPMRGGTTL